MTKPDLLEALCAYFDGELERQETVLALTRAQGQAARCYDLEGLEAKTQALNLLIQEAVDAEALRLRLVKALVEAYALPRERQTLSGLIEATQEPWRHRIREFQQRMQAISRDCRAAARENRVAMRRGLRVVNDALESIVRGVTAAEAAYTSQGIETVARGFPAGLIDHRG